MDQDNTEPRNHRIRSTVIGETKEFMITKDCLQGEAVDELLVKYRMVQGYANDTHVQSNVRWFALPTSDGIKKVNLTYMQMI